MKIFRLLTLVLFLLYCDNSEIPYKTVDLNKTQKVKVQGNWKSQHTISYLWSKIQGPKDHNSSRIINGNTMLFNPGLIGEYVITVSIENSMGRVLGEEKFYYNVINSKDNINHMPSSSIDMNNKVDIINIDKLDSAETGSNGYTIQIASWNTFKDALKDRNYLNENGFDAYIKEFIIDEKTWYRVRVGRNLSYNKCIKLIDKLKKIVANNIWIDEF